MNASWDGHKYIVSPWLFKIEGYRFSNGLVTTVVTTYQPMRRSIFNQQFCPLVYLSVCLGLHLSYFISALVKYPVSVWKWNWVSCWLDTRWLSYSRIGKEWMHRIAPRKPYSCAHFISKVSQNEEKKEFLEKLWNVVFCLIFAANFVSFKYYSEMHQLSG